MSTDNANSSEYHCSSNDIHLITTYYFEISKAMRCQMKNYFKSKGIKMIDGMAIASISKRGPMRVSELCSHMGLPKSTVSGMLDRLESAGMLQRIRSEKDHRSITLHLTEHCMQEHDNALGEAELGIRTLLKNASHEDIDTIIAGLTTFHNILSNSNE